VRETLLLSVPPVERQTGRGGGVNQLAFDIMSDARPRKGRSGPRTWAGRTRVAVVGGYSTRNQSRRQRGARRLIKSVTFLFALSVQWVIVVAERRFDVQAVVAAGGALGRATIEGTTAGIAVPEARSTFASTARAFKVSRWPRGRLSDTPPAAYGRYPFE
jgi:hypothetical protein